MSMLLPPFQIHLPTTVEEAVRLKAEHPESDWLAGGTDLLPNYKWGLNARKHVISLANVEGLREITPTRIGALVTLTQLEKSTLLGTTLPIIPKTARQIASPLLRNSGTLGGNLMLENRCFFFNQTYMWRESKGFCMKADGDACLVVPQKDRCYATFSADLPAALIALDATITVANADGERVVPLKRFYQCEEAHAAGAGRAQHQPDGIARYAMEHGDLIVGVNVPEEAQQWRATYHKLRLRDSFDFPELGVAAAVKLRGGNLDGFRLVANALETAPVVLDRLGERHLGNPLSDEAIADIAQAAEAEVRPVKNTNLPPSYRKAMTRVFVKRALEELRHLS